MRFSQRNEDTQNKYPVPSVFESADAFHMTDSIGKNSTEGACERSHTEEDCDSERKFVSFVEICEVEGDTREISRFHHPQEHPRNQ
jgi:hypothetical protein